MQSLVLRLVPTRLVSLAQKLKKVTACPPVTPHQFACISVDL